MLSTEAAGGAIAAAGAGVISAGIWIQFGDAAGLMAFGAALVVIGAGATGNAIRDDGE